MKTTTYLVEVEPKKQVEGPKPQREKRNNIPRLRPMPQTKQSGKQQKSSVGQLQFKIITELELKV